MAEALRTTYCVPQIGSKLARLACGPKRSVRAAAPCASAGADCLPVVARLPAAATLFRNVLRSILDLPLALVARLDLRHAAIVVHVFAKVESRHNDVAP